MNAFTSERRPGRSHCMGAKAFLVLSALVAFFSCTVDTRVAAPGPGTGTETTNSYAQLPSGKAAAGCSVKLIAANDWLLNAHAGADAVVVDSTTANDDGLFSFTMDSARPNDLFNVQIDSDSATLLVRRVRYLDISERTFMLEPGTRVAGKVALGNGIDTSLRVLLEGTSYRSRISPDGSFLFTTIPPGPHGLMLGGTTGIAAARSVTIGPGQDVDVGTVEPRLDRVVLTDFESGYAAPLMEPVVRQLVWYQFSDFGSKVYDYETGFWIPALVPDSTLLWGSTRTAAYLTARGLGTAIRFEADLDTTVLYPYAGLGIDFSAYRGRGLDLTALKALRFDAGGSGTLIVSLKVDSKEYPFHIRFQKQISLAPVVTGYTVPTDSLSTSSSMDSVGISWNTVRGDVSRLEFRLADPHAPGATVHATIDNIALEGVRLEDL